MASTVTTPDGQTHVIMTSRDLLDLIDAYMGLEAREAVVEQMNEQELLHADDEECIREMNDMLGDLSKHHKEVCQNLYDAQKGLADLIAARDLDRRAISSICGKLSAILHREINTNH